MKRDCGHDSAAGITCKCGMIWCPDCYAEHVCPEPLPSLWPTQVKGLQAIRDAFKAGHRRILVTAPTGGGKTRMMAEIARGVADKSRRAVIYSNRRMLTTQTSRKLSQAGLVDHGMLLSGERTAFLRDLQVASIQTVYSWLQREKMELPSSDVVLWDESHSQKGQMATELMTQHLEQGAVIIGFTATPIGLGAYFDVLVEAGTKKELREIGALVPARVFGPDEPDLKHIGVDKSTYTEGEQTDAIIRPKIFGRVWEHWSRLQKELLGVTDLRLDARPTVLFAPGVKHSMWFAEQFDGRGIRAAHIDGKTPDDERRDILRGVEEGEIKVVCNRFVLREGIDIPCLEHGIFACVLGLQAWIQSAGRLLRASPSTGKKFAVIQEHGGHFWRHGDINDDIDWQLGDTLADVHRKRKAAMESGDVKEDFRCPQCGEIIKPYDLQHFGGCPHCGKKFKRSVREVVMVDGTLKKMYGAARPRRRKHKVKLDGEKLWDQCFWASLHAKRKMSLIQVKMWFYSERHKQGMDDAQPPYGAWNCPEHGSIDWTMYVREKYGKYVKKTV